MDHGRQSPEEDEEVIPEKSSRRIRNAGRGSAGLELTSFQISPCLNPENISAEQTQPFTCLCRLNQPLLPSLPLPLRRIGETLLLFSAHIRLGLSTQTASPTYIHQTTLCRSRAMSP